MVMLIRGNHMRPGLQAQMKAVFVHRHTGEHKPDWALSPMPNGDPCPVQFADDTDWLAHTYFPVTVKGELSRREKYCESHPTWPHNPELRRN